MANLLILYYVTGVVRSILYIEIVVHELCDKVREIALQHELTIEFFSISDSEKRHRALSHVGGFQLWWLDEVVT